jgi:hypothetical protein
VLLASADDQLIKAIVECDINTLNRNNKVTIDEKGKLRKYNNRLRELVYPKICFKSKYKLLIQKVGSIFPLLASVLSGVIGALTITIENGLAAYDSFFSGTVVKSFLGTTTTR